MAFIVQQPHSNTNLSSSYRVAWLADVMAYANGARQSYAYTAFKDYASAVAARDKANNV